MEGKTEDYYKTSQIPRPTCWYHSGSGNLAMMKYDNMIVIITLNVIIVMILILSPSWCWSWSPGVGARAVRRRDGKAAESGFERREGGGEHCHYDDHPHCYRNCHRQCFVPLVNNWTLSWWWSSALSSSLSSPILLSSFPLQIFKLPGSSGPLCWLPFQPDVW